MKFLSQDLFTDVTKGEKRIVDILAEVQLKGETTAIIIHVENQSYVQMDFNERMFIYFSRLYEKYHKRILPIAVFSHGDSRYEPDKFEISFPFKNVLSFEYYKLELHHRNWREYIDQDNPVAAALLSQMGFEESEKVQVKREFLRMLVRLKLDEAKTQLITGFFENYVKLTDEEEIELRKEIEQLDAHEAESIFRIETSWERRGRIEGKIEGKKEGEWERNIEIAKRMLAEEMSIDKVVRLTDLSKEEVENLK